MIDIEKAQIIEEIRDINWKLVDAIMKDDEKEVIKNKILFDNLIKLYLKEDGQTA